MYFMMAVMVVVATYLWSFKEDFEGEDFEKAVPFVIVVVTIVFVLGLLSSLVGGK